MPHPAAYTVAYRTDPEQKERSAYIRLFWQAGKAESRIAIQGMAEHGGRSADGFAQGMQMGHNSLLVTR